MGAGEGGGGDGVGGWLSGREGKGRGGWRAEKSVVVVRTLARA